MIPLKNNPNVDNSDLPNYPDGRIKDNTGSGNGTPVNRSVYGDLHSNISKLMRLYNITPNELPDNETNGFQIIAALIALANKNDFILNLGSTSGVLTVGVKLGSLLTDEQIVCKASVDWTAETTIKGSDNVVVSMTKYGNFKTGEFIRLIKTVGGVDLVRLCDSISINQLGADAGFLKKATQAEENAGAIDTKATTPLSNKTTFIKRVNGSDSGGYLAKPVGDPDERNGLLSKEDKSIIDSFVNKTKNVGWFAGLDVGISSGVLPVDGNITVATVTSNPSPADESFITCTMANAMPDTNYYVRSFIESQGIIANDNDIAQMVFRPISTTQFTVSLKGFNTTQSLKVHLEVVQI